jgi:hypothetical protein
VRLLKASPIDVALKTQSSGFAGSIEWCDDVTLLVDGWPNDHLFAWTPELFQVVVFDVSKLSLNQSWFCSLTIFVKADGAHNGAELGFAHVLSQLLVVNGLGGIDGLLNHLADGIVERGQVVA